MTSTLGAVIAKFIITDITDYLVCFLIGTGLSFMSFTLCFSMDHSEFDYERHNRIGMRKKHKEGENPDKEMEAY